MPFFFCANKAQFLEVCKVILLIILLLLQKLDKKVILWYNTRK